MFSNSFRLWPGVPNYSNYSQDALQYLLYGFSIDDNHQLQKELGIPQVNDIKEALNQLQQQDRRETKECMESLSMRFKGRIDIKETIENDIPLVISHDVFFLPMKNWVTNITYLITQLNTITYGSFDTHVCQIANEIGIKNKLQEENISEGDVENIIQYLGRYSRQFKFFVHKNKFPDPNAFKTFGQGFVFIHLLLWNNFLHPVQMSYDSWYTLNESLKKEGVRYISIDYEEIAQKKYKTLQKKNYREAGEKGMFILNNNQLDEIRKQRLLENNQESSISLKSASQSNDQSKSSKKLEKELKKLHKNEEESEILLKTFLKMLTKVKKYADYNYNYKNILERKWEEGNNAFKFKKSVMFFVNDQSKQIFGYKIETILAHKTSLENSIQQIIETQLYSTPSVSSISSSSRQSQSQLDKSYVDGSEHSFSHKFSQCQIK